MMAPPTRKALLIASIMVAALIAFISVIAYSRHLAETESEASVYAQP